MAVYHSYFHKRDAIVTPDGAHHLLIPSFRRKSQDMSGGCASNIGIFFPLCGSSRNTRTRGDYDNADIFYFPLYINCRRPGLIKCRKCQGLGVCPGTTFVLKISSLDGEFPPGGSGLV